MDNAGINDVEATMDLFEQWAKQYSRISSKLERAPSEHWTNPRLKPRYYWEPLVHSLFLAFWAGYKSGKEEQ